MALRWFAKIDGACGTFFVESVSPWFSGRHQFHTIKPRSGAQAALELNRIKTHGYFSMRVDQKHALAEGTTMPCKIQSLFGRQQRKDEPAGLLASVLGGPHPVHFP